MKKMSLQWRLTCIITLYIAVICGCVTMRIGIAGHDLLITGQEGSVKFLQDSQPLFTRRQSNTLRGGSLQFLQ